MLSYRGLVVLGACLAIIQAGSTAWAEGSSARSRTKQLIIHLDNIGQRQASASESGHTAADLSLPDGRPVSVLRSFSGNGLVVELPEEIGLEEARQIALEISARAGVASVEPDKRFYPALEPDDPEYPVRDLVTDPGQWHLHSLNEPAGIRMPEAWDLSTGSAGVTVAVIDTGIIPHSDLTSRVLAGYDFYSDLINDNDGEPGRDSNPTDPGDAVNAGDCGPGEPAETSSWHGLSVMGVILASSDNGRDIAGVDFSASLLPIRVLGRCGGNLSDVADAIRWAAGVPVAGAVPNINPNPADVINLSLSGDGPCSQTEQSAINDAVAEGAVIVTAAGNDDGENVADVSPANCDNVIVVGAIARDAAIASYTNVGLAVDLTAPGGDSPEDEKENNILTLWNDGQIFPGSDELAYVQGTSFTTAQVSGVASLMLSLDPNLTPAVIEDVIKATTRSFPDTSCDQALCGTGVLNAAAALIAAQDTSAIEADEAPVADAGDAASGKVGDTIDFDGSGSNDPDGSPGPLTYAWDFGDDSFATGVSPSHTYDTGGIFTVSLVVNDGFKDSEVSVTTATIEDGQKTVDAGGGGGGCTMLAGRAGKTDLLWWLALVVLAGRISVWRKPI